MATRYCDLDAITNGTGTNTNPFQQSQLIDYLAGTVPTGASSIVATNDTIRIKGKFNESGTSLFEIVSSATDVDLVPNSTSKINTPWCLSADEVKINGINPIIRDACISNLYLTTFEETGFDSASYGHTFNSCLFLEDFDIRDAGDINHSNYFNGCTFSLPVMQFLEYGTSAITHDYFNFCYFDDVELLKLESNSPDGAIYIHLSACTFSSSQLFALSGVPTSALTVDNCTFDLGLSASIPAWDDVSYANRQNLNYATFKLPYYYNETLKYSGLGITNALVASNRRGRGAFWFDPNLYVDLDTATSGTWGTSALPFNYEEWLEYTHQATYKAENFYIKGSKSLTSDPNLDSVGNIGLTVYPWDAVTNGPWRIRSTSDITLSANGWELNDGIISTDGDLISNYLTLNDIFLSAGSEVIVDNHLGAYGSTLICKSLKAVNAVSFTIDDCILDTSGMYTDGTVCAAEVDNCVTSSPDINILLSGTAGAEMVAPYSTATNMQYGFTVPTWPLWNGTQDEYKYTVLAQDITINGTGSW